ncbi:MAG: hypothetical protein R2882_12605 [Gemmatimonadales bacterium]
MGSTNPSRCPRSLGANAGFVFVFAVIMALLIVPIKRMLARQAS